MENAVITPIRPTYWNIPHWAEIGQYLFGFLAIAIFIYGLWIHLQRWRSGKSEKIELTLGQRIQAFCKYALLQARLSTEPRALIMHLGIFWGMVFLAIGTALATVDWDVTHLFFGFQFLVGHSYILFELVLDIAGVVLIVGLIIAIYRRYILHLEKLKTISPPTFPLDSFYLLAILLVVAVTGFLIEGLRLAITDIRWEESRSWAFAGNGLSKLFRLMSDDAIRSSHLFLWIVHALFAFVFIASIPFSKAFHMVASGVSIFLRRISNPGILHPEGTSVEKISDFTWRQLLQFDGCTWCGRCQEVCPANISGYSLSPKNVILKLNGQPVERQKKESNDKDSQTNTSALHGSAITAEELWACTTCIACEVACPVFIEQPRAIIELRRHLVNQGEIDKNQQETLARMQRYGNSFGQSDRMRAKWTEGLEFKIKDARKEPVEYLWWVGDYASYDARLQDITRMTAKLFNLAGLDFGIAYEGERNSGNDIRRIGEEGLFELLKDKNLQTLNKAKFQTIVTTDPHAYNALKNEYSLNGNGNTLKVKHYTEVLDDMIKRGQLKLTKKSSLHVTYHDPCYLGRYNGIYNEPRNILRAIGVNLIEMKRNGDRSFCCGAGGGRIWMEEDASIKERPSENRIREAVAETHAEIFVVACPKDMVMFQDAVKTTGNEAKIVVRDISELVWEALEH